MPEIVLLILKIIGIILLAILAIGLLLVFALLFLPVRYKAKAEADSERKEEDGKPYVDLKLKASWLLFFTALVEYQKEKRIRLRAFGITVYDSAKSILPKKKQEKPQKDSAEERDKVKESTSDNVSKETDNKETLKRERGEAKEDNTVTKEDNVSDKEKQSKNPFTKLRYAIERFCDTLRNIKEKKDAVINLWNDAQTVKCRNLIVQELMYLLKHLKPSKVHGFLHFGFDDPALTGYGMAAYGMMIPVWGDFLTVEPEFENTILQTSLTIKGKMKGFSFLKVFLKLCFSKDFRSVIKKVKALK